jgi:hypothetical protein
MRAKPLKTRDLILSLSKDEDAYSGFFSSLLETQNSVAARLFRRPLAFKDEICQRTASHTFAGRSEIGASIHSGPPFASL